MPHSWNEIRDRSLAFSREWAVDAAYGKTTFKTEAERVAYLFERYQQLTAPLTKTDTKNTKKGRKS